MRTDVFVVSYVFDTPTILGPLKGTTRSLILYEVGDTIYAVFGRATVVSCVKLHEAPVDPV